MLATFVSLLVIGCATGVLSGLLGVGGGMISIPTFRLILGLSAVATTATSLAVIIPTAITGAITHVREKTCIVWLGAAMGLGGACTSALGAYLASIAPSAAVMCVAAVVIGYSAITMLQKVFKKPQVNQGAKKDAEDASAFADEQTAENGAALAAEQTASGNGAPDAFSQTPSSEDKPTLKRCVIGFAIGLIAGLVAGFIGVGGGFIMVPLMTIAFGFSMHKASGTSLVGIAILAIPGVIEHMMLGNVNYVVALAMCIGTIPGAIVGTKLAKRFSDRGLRLIFGVMLVIVAFMLVANEFISF